ncbi:hypothetical protein HPB50_007070 [Hyalomma asiaticum]|uniref:Uncharacterized protein n=1 Tax=Hyalomma asiaticum TaxID=266040 RepID=A0ACB7SSG3_HYAAI|nr:hypothetical protein HPB50_007070 [Hyalomma asiaticum]
MTATLGHRGGQIVGPASSAAVERQAAAKSLGHAGSRGQARPVQNGCPRSRSWIFFLLGLIRRGLPLDQALQLQACGAAGGDMLAARGGDAEAPSPTQICPIREEGRLRSVSGRAAPPEAVWSRSTWCRGWQSTSSNRGQAWSNTSRALGWPIVGANELGFIHFSEKLKMNVKTKDEYGLVMHLVKSNPQTYRHNTEGHRTSYHDEVSKSKEIKLQELTYSGMDIMPMPVYDDDAPPPGVDDYAVMKAAPQSTSQAVVVAGQQQLAQRKPVTIPKPQWHPPWKLYRVISGHTGWVRCLAVEPGNQWFCTGSNDRIIKIWDLATGKLKLSLTGHISGVRGLAVSSRQPYLFSCGEDKQVKCWDLEYNKASAV